jgi:hypothetical protein
MALEAMQGLDQAEVEVGLPQAQEISGRGILFHRRFSAALPALRNMVILNRIAGALPKFGLSVNSIENKSYLAEFNGQTFSGSASSLIQFKGIKDAPVWTYLVNKDKNEVISEDRGRFDSQALFNYTVNSSEAGSYAVVASMTPLPKEIVLREPNRLDTASVDVTFWEVRAVTQNISDIWARWQGRSIYRQPLPQLFWHYPGYTVGLAGSSFWRDVFPVVGNESVEYMVGVSAWCNTWDPYPTEAECCAARRSTWWNSTIEARRVAGSEWTTLGSDQINLSYHNSATFTTSSATYNGRCVAQGPALCGWETGPNCS